jgi:hypothetical protein
MTDNVPFLDELLDQALARYSVAEPRPGLEQRILARLEVRDAEPAHWWRRHWLPLAATAVLVVAAAVVLTRKPVVSPAPVIVASQPRPTLQPALPVVPEPEIASRPKVSRPGRRRSPAVAGLPRQPQFPSPGTLTADERLLQQYLDQVPRDALLASVLKPEPLRDLSIREVRVLPVEIKALPERSGEAMEN